MFITHHLQRPLDYIKVVHQLISDTISHYQTIQSTLINYRREPMNTITQQAIQLFIAQSKEALKRYEEFVRQCQWENLSPRQQEWLSYVHFDCQYLTMELKQLEQQLKKIQSSSN